MTSRTPPPLRNDTAETKTRLQIDLLDRIYGVISSWPGWVLSDAMTVAVEEYLRQAEAEEVVLYYVGERIIKKAGEPYPQPPVGIKPGKTPGGAGRKRGKSRSTTLHLPADLTQRIRNYVAWSGGLRLAWALEDAAEAWIARYQPPPSVSA